MMRLNNNIVLFTSLFIKQNAFLRVQDLTLNSKMSRYASSASLWFSKFGDPSKVVQLKEEPIPNPNSKEVLVKMIIAPVNPADMNLIQGVYPLKPSLPAVPGLEGIGIVEAVGDGVKSVIPGDRVVPNGEALGTWRTHGIFPEDKVFKVRNDVDYVELAGLTVNPATAYRMLKDFVDLKPGDTIIQNGANSAAGQNVIQLCKIWGINSINVVRHRPEIDELKEYLTCLGATHVITDKEIRDFTICDIPKPVLALNCVGGAIVIDMLRFLANRSYVVTYGGMSREPVAVPTSALIFKDIRFTGYWMTRWYKENRGSDKHKTMMDDLTSYMNEKKLKAPQHELVPLKDFRIAIMNTLNKQGFIGTKFLLDMRE